MKKSVVATMQVLVDLPDRRVVAGLGADQKLAVGPSSRLARKQLLQDRRRELAAAAAAMRETCERKKGRVHLTRLQGKRRAAAADPRSRARRLEG